MSFSKFEYAIQAALDEKRIVGAAVVAADKSGDEPLFVKGYGHASIGENPKSMQPDSVLWIASCTKLMTAVAVLQCVENGLLNLDADISDILHEWKSPDIILGFDEATATPITKKATTPITLRQLLTHSSGMGYDAMNPILQRYRKVHRGLDPSPEIRKVANEHTVALTFEPGQGWDYGSSTDWAGQIVERVNGGQRLGDYMAEHIWVPLGMSSTTFEVLKHPDMMKRLCEYPTRTPDGSYTLETGGMFPVVQPEDDSGGAGLYSCAADYLKLMVSLLRDDGKLLKPESVIELFRPQLEDTKYLDEAFRGPFAPFLLPGMPEGVKWNFALGGVVAVDGMENRAGKGTVMWSGASNTYWFIDREREICGMYASQLQPPGDAETAVLNAAFQTDVYGLKTKS